MHAGYRNHNIGPLKCRIQLSNTSIEAEMLLNKSRVGRCEVRVDVDPPAKAPRQVLRRVKGVMSN
jgi:hypothetical protein